MTARISADKELRRERPGHAPGKASIPGRRILGALVSRPQHAEGVGFSAITALGHDTTCACRDWCFARGRRILPAQASPPPQRIEDPEPPEGGTSTHGNPHRRELPPSPRKAPYRQEPPATAVNRAVDKRDRPDDTARHPGEQKRART